MIDAALSWATRRAQAVGLSLSNDDVADLVQDVLVQTMSGKIRWRHERVSLLDHVRDTIRRRISRRVSRPRRNRRHPLDVSVIASSEDEPTTEAEGVLVQLAGPDERDGRAMADLVARVLPPLEAAVDGRANVRTLLDAYLHQITDPREVMRHTGLSLGEFRQARRGLMQAVRTLPVEVRGAVHAILNKV